MTNKDQGLPYCISAAKERWDACKAATFDLHEKLDEMDDVRQSLIRLVCERVGTPDGVFHCAGRTFRFETIDTEGLYCFCDEYYDFQIVQFLNQSFLGSHEFSPTKDYNPDPEVVKKVWVASELWEQCTQKAHHLGLVLGAYAETSSNVHQRVNQYFRENRERLERESGSLLPLNVFSVEGLTFEFVSPDFGEMEKLGVRIEPTSIARLIEPFSLV